MSGIDTFNKNKEGFLKIGCIVFYLGVQRKHRKTIFDHRLEESESSSHVHIGGRPFETKEAVSACKVPEMRAHMSYSRNSVETS